MRDIPCRKVKKRLGLQLYGARQLSKPHTATFCDETRFALIDRWYASALIYLQHTAKIKYIVKMTVRTGDIFLLYSLTIFRLHRYERS
jgi:hypothetical protein